jgi:23S rRNA pseudouridine1911/1915/1917 synthase
MQAIQILEQDDDYIFVNKPSGMLTIPDRHDGELPSVVGSLRKQFGSIFIVHRIDKDTSGCLVFAKHEEAHRHASILFEKRQVTKKYLGLVHGSMPDDIGLVQDKIMEHPTIKGKMVVNAREGKEAITAYKVLNNFRGYSLIEFTIHTGRMHQIRLHSANLGAPIICDPIYGKSEPVFVSEIKRKPYKLDNNLEQELPILQRLALHSHLISFGNVQNVTVGAEAPLHKDMAATLRQLEKWGKGGL